MTREELFNAFREVASKEFAHIPDEDDIEYEFSERFNKKMDKLFKKIERNSNYPTVGHSKRIITVLAAILIIFTGLMSVSAIREPVVNFIVEKYETFIELFFWGDTSEQIEYEYGFSKIPKGFELINKTNSDGVVYSEYKNAETEEVIILDQSITDGSWISIDNEHGETTIEIIKGNKTYIYTNNNGEKIQAIWIKGTYYFILTYYGEIEKNEFIDLISTIE